jgi:hypothetical protein
MAPNRDELVEKRIQEAVALVRIDVQLFSSRDIRNLVYDLGEHLKVDGPSARHQQTTEACLLRDSGRREDRRVLALGMQRLAPEKSPHHILEHRIRRRMVISRKISLLGIVVVELEQLVHQIAHPFDDVVRSRKIRGSDLITSGSDSSILAQVLSRFKYCERLTERRCDSRLSRMSRASHNKVL